MRALRAWICRLAGLLPNERREQDLTAEIESNLQLHVDENLRSGMTSEQARRQALLALGGMESAKEACRDRSTVPWIEHLLQDVHFSFRQFRKNAGFTFTAVFTLALGMCASVAIFSFVDAALIKPLPYTDPQHLVGVYESTQKWTTGNLSYFDYLDWRKRNTVFRSLDAYNDAHFMLRTFAGNVATRGARVSESFFRTLGVHPVLGRDFLTSEGSPAGPHTVLLSYASWRNRFGGKKDVLGQTLSLDGTAYTLIGILPADFHFAPAGSPEFWTTLNVSGSCEQRRSCHNLYGVARLKGGISLEAARSNVASIARELEKEFPGSNLGQGSNLVPLTEVITGDHRTLLLTLLGGAALLLLISCVNVASLLLVRSEGRKREMAIRSALGASRTRLICQSMTESLLLVAASAGIGLLSAHWAIKVLRGMIPEDVLANMPYLQGLGLNERVLAFAAVISFLAAFILSLIPTGHTSQPDAQKALAEGGRGSAGTTWHRLGSKLVVTELATAMVLLVSAGLLGRSFYHMLQMDLGLQPDHLATLQVAAPGLTYKKPEQSIKLAREVMDRISNLPGVKSVGICSQLPVSFNGNTDWIRFVGKPYHGEHNDVNERDVSAGYFQTVKAKLLRGRYFRPNEDTSKPRVIIINQALARMYFPREDPIGRQVGNGDLTPSSIREIVGLVDDIREGPLDEPMLPTEYIPFNQDPDYYFAVVARTSQNETSVLPAIAAAIRQIDPAIVTANETSLNEMIHDAPSTYLRRSSAWLAGGFAAAALLLGIVGLYGVIAYSVAQRTREIGVRMALGAQRGKVYALVLREAGALVGFGVALGMVCSIAAATLIKKLLFGTPAWDAPTLCAVAIVLASAALLASYLPARRAASVNPIDALRAE